VIHGRVLSIYGVVEFASIDNNTQQIFDNMSYVKHSCFKKVMHYVRSLLLPRTLATV
jgi:hypothetical protein